MVYNTTYGLACRYFDYIRTEILAGILNQDFFFIIIITLNFLTKRIPNIISIIF